MGAGPQHRGGLVAPQGWNAEAERAEGGERRDRASSAVCTPTLTVELWETWGVP